MCPYGMQAWVAGDDLEVGASGGVRLEDGGNVLTYGAEEADHRSVRSSQFQFSVKPFAPASHSGACAPGGQLRNGTDTFLLHERSPGTGRVQERELGTENGVLSRRFGSRRCGRRSCGDTCRD